VVICCAPLPPPVASPQHCVGVVVARAARAKIAPNNFYDLYLPVLLIHTGWIIICSSES
jgi:hypothetical protein